MSRLRPGASARVVRAVVGNPSLRRVLAAFLLYNAAEFGTWVAILVYAYDASGPAAVGVVALAQLLPAAAFAPLAASLADRYPRERVLLVGYLAQTLTFAAVTAGMALAAPPVAVYVAAAGLAAALTFTRPAQGALLPALSRTPEELTAANSAAGTVEGLGVLLGPLAAAAILALATPAVALGAGMVACLAAAALVVRLRVEAGAAEPPPMAGDAGFHVHATGVHEPASHPDMHHTGDGHAAVQPGHRDPADRADEDTPIDLITGGLRAALGPGHTRTVVALLGLRMLTSGALDVLFVLLAIEALGTGQSGAGILTGALGLGTVLGGAASVALVGRQQLAPAMAAAAVGFGLPLVALGTVVPGAAAAVCIAIAGIGFAAIDVTGRTLLQRVTPDRRLARILGALEGIGLVFLALGSALAPLLAGWVGVTRALVVVAVLLPVGVLVAWRSLRHIDSHAHVPVRAMGLLRRNAVLGLLPGPALERVARRTRWVTLRDGEVLIREGDRGDRFYVLESGSLRVTIGGTFVRTTDAPGDGVGEIALLRDIPRTATVVATEPCVLLAVDRAVFLAAVTGNTQAGEAASGRARALVAEDRLRPEEPPKIP